MSSTDGPIGIFDSGFGGLTVARSVVDQMPNEDIVYLGDTARAPTAPKACPRCASSPSNASTGSSSAA